MSNFCGFGELCRWSGCSHVSGVSWNISPSLALGNPCDGPVNIGPGAGGRNNGFASGSVNNFNGQANLA
ncbi:hypothetical protein SLEP1_g40047 [Rubroshorea leprosula]|uniref:Uncharacterized protein n=1 Tax=Rubroshorea leprosula TaxID=152421 RepID=A0AAV5L272_9ROSI|nr:hypothetical protein SLEP1_g40047 [Rubroshorea leprosula]